MRKVALLTREYPPEVYGGAGVHVEYLARELARVADVTVHCWGDERPSVPGGPTVVAYRPWDALAGPEPYAAALQALSIDLTMAAGVAGADLVHSHTWYANLGGHLAKLVHGIPHVATVHSLEPMRPWKREQLGGGYAVSSFAERTALESADAIIAVSAAHLREILACYPAIDPARTSVIYNGIDAERVPARPRHRRARAPRDRSGPAVGRLRRQDHAAEGADAPPRRGGRDRPGARSSSSAPARRTPRRSPPRSPPSWSGVRRRAGNVLWIEEMLPKPDVIQILSHATVFVCPSVYEPMGIVNLEAMACEAAVVATAVGGIPEVVEDGVTGLLVPYEARADGTGDAGRPGRPGGRPRRAHQRAPGRPRTRRAMGVAGRARAVERFGWDVAAAETLRLYERLLAVRAGRSSARVRRTRISGFTDARAPTGCDDCVDRPAVRRNRVACQVCVSTVSSDEGGGIMKTRFLSVPRRTRAPRRVSRLRFWRSRSSRPVPRAGAPLPAWLSESIREPGPRLLDGDHGRGKQDRDRSQHPDSAEIRPAERDEARPRGDSDEAASRRRSSVIRILRDVPVSEGVADIELRPLPRGNGRRGRRALPRRNAEAVHALHGEHVRSAAPGSRRRLDRGTPADADEPARRRRCRDHRAQRRHGSGGDGGASLGPVSHRYPTGLRLRPAGAPR